MGGYIRVPSYSLVWYIDTRVSGNSTYLRISNALSIASKCSNVPIIYFEFKHFLLFTILYSTFSKQKKINNREMDLRVRVKKIQSTYEFYSDLYIAIIVRIYRAEIIIITFLPSKTF